jgi:hypothetical protein
LSKSIHSLCHGKKVAKKFALLLSFSWRCSRQKATQ